MLIETIMKYFTFKISMKIKTCDHIKFDKHVDQPGLSHTACEVKN